jgi:hypothetical protein
VLIADERGAKPVSELLAALEHEHGETEIVLSSITMIELEHGLHRAQTTNQEQSRREYLDTVFASIPVEPFHEGDGAACGKDRRGGTAERPYHSVRGSADRRYCSSLRVCNRNAESTSFPDDSGSDRISVLRHPFLSLLNFHHGPGSATDKMLESGLDRVAVVVVALAMFAWSRFGCVSYR